MNPIIISVNIKGNRAIIRQMASVVSVSGLELRGGYLTARLQPEEFATLGCPCCGGGQGSLLLSEVRAGERTSLELAYCRPCEHRYFRKLPSLAWYQRYYSTTWEAPSAPAPLEPAFRRGLRRVKERIRTLFAALWPDRYPPARPHLRVQQALSQWIGVCEGDGSYYLPNPAIRRALEIGCGHGHVLEALRDRGLEVTGTEASPARVETCRRRGLDVVECPVDSLAPLQGRKRFDLIYSTHVLEHIPDPLTHLREALSLLREDGYLYLQVPNAHRGEFFVARSHSPVHCHGYSPRSLALLLGRLGLRPIRIQADRDLQILARRAPCEGALGAWYGTAVPEESLECLRAASERAGEKVRIAWSEAGWTVVHVDSGTTLRRAVSDFSIRSSGSESWMECAVTPGEVSFPIRFEHAGPDPLVWIKSN